MNNNKKNIFCNNCGNFGHLFHQCKVPITSIGVIAMRCNKGKTEILLIRRKDSLSFVDFIRGKYNIEDKDYIINLLNNMTVRERDFIRDNDFDKIWNYLWSYNSNNSYRNEEKISKIKFNKLKEGIVNNNNFYNINDLIKLCSKTYIEPEWGFPKGRRNFQEKDIICGLREFEEETGYSKHNINMINNFYPFEEIFTGSNYKSYKHKYFLGLMESNIEPSNQFQIYEISKIEWVDINRADLYIRDYNIEKKKILFELKLLLKSYKLYI